MNQKFIWTGLIVGSLITISSSSSSPKPKPVPVNKAVTSHHLKNPEFVLKVNGENISWEKYISTLEEQPGVDQIMQGRGKTAGLSVLQNLVYDAALIHLSKAKGIQVTPAEIQKKLDELKKNQPHLQEVLKSSSITEEQVKRELTIQLYQHKYITHGITVSAKEIEEFYKTAKDYTTSAKYKVRLILLSDESKKEEVEKKIKEGTKFEDVAKELSIHSSKNEGGLIAPRSKDQFPPELQAELDKIKVNEVSDWVKAGGATFKVKLEEITPESKQPLDDKLKNEIRERLLIEKGSEKNKLGEAILNYLSEKKIECLYSKYTPAFNQFVNNIKERVKSEKESKKAASEKKPATQVPKGSEKKEENKPASSEQKPTEKAPESSEKKEENKSASSEQKPVEKAPEATGDKKGEPSSDSVKK